MTVTPQGEIYICSVKIKSDNKNQLTFQNPQKQNDYFYSNITHNFSSDDYTYIKKDSSVKININIDQIINSNYLFYRNTGFSNKIYYCFITEMKYINENVTEVFFETDSFQTYYFDINYNASFIEREHVNDDTVGLHTIPEGLETGRFIINNSENIGIGDTCICIASTWDSFKNEQSIGSQEYNGLFSGVTYFVFKNSDYSQDLIYDSPAYFLRALEHQGKSESCQSVFIVPKKLVDYDNIKWDSPEQGLLYHFYKPIPPSEFPVNLMTYNTNKNYNNINGYIPKNKKLFISDYNFIEISNNNGISNTYNYEDFSSNDVKFSVNGVISIGSSINCVPLDYKGVLKNYSESLIAGKFPTCSWFSDTYVNWLTQNSLNVNGINIPDGVVKGTASTIVSGLTTGNVTSGLSQIGSSLFEVYQHSKIPPTSKGNLNSGDVLTALKQNDFTIYKKSIKKEYAKIIDNYFDLFGYKINSVKIPNITGRRNWNFVKTIDCTFTGKIPELDMIKIKNMFDNGVTLWHNAATMFDYSQDNSII